MKKTQVSTKNMVLAAVLAGLAIVFGFIEIPYPPAPFLRFDFSEVAVLVAFSLLGIKYAVITVFLRSLIRFLIGLGTASVIPFFPEIVAILASLVILFLYHVVRQYIIPCGDTCKDPKLQRYRFRRGIILLGVTILVISAFILSQLGLIIFGIIMGIVSHIVAGAGTFALSQIMPLLWITPALGLAFYALKKLHDLYETELIGDSKLAYVIQATIVTLGFTATMTVFNFFIATPIFVSGGAHLWFYSFVQDPAFSFLTEGNMLTYILFTIITYVPFNLMKGALIFFTYWFVQRAVTELENR